MKPDQKHQDNLHKLLQLTAVEIRRRVTVVNFHDPDFIASEVLVCLVRMRFGQGNGLLDCIVNALYGRLMRLIDMYFRKNPHWGAIVNSSSETLVEATSVAWVALNKDTNPVSFAEVRFLPWVEARVEDYLQEQLALKNSMPSYDALTAAADEDGDSTAHENLLKSDEEDGPEAVAQRREISDNLIKIMTSWEPMVRHAVYYRLECDYDWDTTAQLMGVSKPTARKYYNIGIERLNGAINE